MSFLSFLSVGLPAEGRLVYRPVYPQEIAAVVPDPGSGGGGRKKKKRGLLAYEPIPDAPEVKHDEATQEAVVLGEDIAQQIIESGREVARIKTQMRLSSNSAAIQAMESEIAAIEKHLKAAKRQAEDDLILSIIL